MYQKAHRILFCFLLFFPLYSHATLNGSDRMSMMISDHGQRFLGIYPSRVLDRFHVLVSLDTQTQIRTYDYHPPSASRVVLKDPLMMLDFHASMGLFHHYQIGFTLPNLIWQPNINGNNSILAPSSGPQIFQLEGKLMLLKGEPNKSPLGLSFVHSMNAPFDNGGPRLDSHIPVFNFEFALDWDVPPFLWAFNLGYRVRHLRSPSAPPDYILDDQVLMGFGAHYYIESLHLIPIAEIHVSTPAAHAFQDSARTAAELLVGASKIFPRNLNAFLGLGWNMTSAIGMADLRITFGISWSIAPYRPRVHDENRHRNLINALLVDALQKSPRPKDVAYDLPADLIEFKWDQETLRHQPQRSLDNIALAIKEFPEVKGLLIECFTDGISSEEINLKSGEQRLQSLKTYLIEQGISEDKIQTRSMGSVQKVETDELFENRVKNQRFRLIFALE